MDRAQTLSVIVENLHCVKSFRISDHVFTQTQLVLAQFSDGEHRVGASRARRLRKADPVS